MHVSSDKNSYTPNSTVRLNFRLLDQDYSPMTEGEIEVLVSRGFDPKALTEVSQVTLQVDEKGEVSHQLENVSAGVYRVRAKSSVRGREVIAEDILQEYERTKDDNFLYVTDSTALGKLYTIKTSNVLNFIDSIFTFNQLRYTSWEFVGIIL